MSDDSSLDSFIETEVDSNMLEGMNDLLSFEIVQDNYIKRSEEKEEARNNKTVYENLKEAVTYQNVQHFQFQLKLRTNEKEVKSITIQPSWYRMENLYYVDERAKFRQGQSIQEDFKSIVNMETHYEEMDCYKEDPFYYIHKGMSCEIFGFMYSTLLNASGLSRQKFDSIMTSVRNEYDYFHSDLDMNEFLYPKIIDHGIHKIIPISILPMILQLPIFVDNEWIDIVELLEEKLYYSFVHRVGRDLWKNSYLQLKLNKRMMMNRIHIRASSARVNERILEKKTKNLQNDNITLKKKVSDLEKETSELRKDFLCIAKEMKSFKRTKTSNKAQNSRMK